MVPRHVETVDFTSYQDNEDAKQWSSEVNRKAQKFQVVKNARREVSLSRAACRGTAPTSHRHEVVSCTNEVTSQYPFPDPGKLCHATCSKWCA